MSTTQGDMGVGDRVSGLCERGSSGQGAARSGSLRIITTIAIAHAVYILRPLYFLQSTGAPGTAAQCFWGEPQTWGPRAASTPKKNNPYNVQFGHLFRVDAVEWVFFLFPFLPVLSYCLSFQQHYYKMELLFCIEKEKQPSWCFCPFKKRGIGTIPSL